MNFGVKEQVGWGERDTNNIQNFELKQRQGGGRKRTTKTQTIFKIGYPYWLLKLFFSLSCSTFVKHRIDVVFIS